MESGHDAERTAQAFGKLTHLIRTLRSENGCPWDKKQTPMSFHPYILEEYHEMVQALNSGNSKEIVDEAGDLIFLVVFVAYLYEQEGLTTLADIIEGVVDKMVRRHPHVFADASAETPEDVINNWRTIKSSEENIRARESLLDGIPRSLPALSRAQKLAARAARVKFDWTDAHGVFEKIDEEVGELRQAATSGSPDEIREEMGDVLFVLVNAARHLSVNGEAALNETSDKFERRFRYIEEQMRARGKALEQADLKEMDELWNEAKAQEKSRTRRPSS